MPSQKHAITCSFNPSLSLMPPRERKKKPAKCSACLRGDLKPIFTILFPWVNPSEDEREQIQPGKKYKHSSRRPCTRLPLLPHTDRKNWPHQVLEVIGYPLKNLNTTWTSNTAKHTHTHSFDYTTQTLVSAVILTMLIVDLGSKVWV